LGLNALQQLASNCQNEFELPSQFVYWICIGAHAALDGKLQAHLDKICQSSPSPIDVMIDLLPLELTSPDSIERFAQHVLSHVVSAFKKIDHMVLNAGIFLRNPQQAVQLSDGREFESTFFVNTLSQSLLLKRLLPAMADDGRIVMVSSKMHLDAVKGMSLFSFSSSSTMDLLTIEPPVTPSTIDDYLGPKKWGGRQVYQISKLVQMHLSFILKDEIQRRWTKPSVGPTVVTVSPGNPLL